METHGLCYLFVATVPRFYLPVKPCLTCANLGGADGFAELGTRFKAAHVKRIIWWLARETQEFADSNPQVPRADLFTQKFARFLFPTCGKPKGHQDISKYHQII